MENPIFKLANDMITEAEDNMPIIKEICDFCGAKLEDSDHELGHGYTDGRWACQKCYEQSNDVIE